MTSAFPEHLGDSPQYPGSSSLTTNPSFTRSSPVSTPAERLRSIEELRQRIHTEFARLDWAFAAGTLTFDEYIFYVKKTHGGKLEHELLRDLEREERALRDEMNGHVDEGRPLVTTVTAALALLLIVGLGLFAAFGHLVAGPTGFVTLTPTQQVVLPTTFAFTASGSMPLNVTNTSSLQITGSLANGTASTYLNVDGQRYLAYQGDASPGASVLTGMASYALNETIDVTVTPTNAEYTLWLTDENGVKQPVFEPFSIAVPGAYTLDALVNDSDNISKVSTSFLVRNDTNGGSDVTNTVATNTISFTDACIETCTLNKTGDATLTLEVVLSDGAVLNITSITTTEPRQNHAPIKIVTVPNVTLEEGASTTLDLNNYFTDPDNDTLTYDYMDVPGVTMSATGSTLTITGNVAGTQTSIIYASDLYSITPSNQFSITVTPGTTNTTINETTGNGTVNTTNESVTNTTTNGTNNETNTTIMNVTTNTTTNETSMTITNESTNTTVNTTLDCSNPDPNQRPLDCIQSSGSTYFKPEELLIENKQALAVGKLTPIGNLLIKGDVIEHTSGAPVANDYQIGYNDANGDFVPTIWISTADGNLYLKGSLTEMNGNIDAPQGWSSMANSRGIVLATFDRRTGDLTVRGNVIPYRRSFG